jgi:hypothetical protein
MHPNPFFFRKDDKYYKYLQRLVESRAFVSQNLAEANIHSEASAATSTYTAAALESQRNENAHIISLRPDPSTFKLL